MILSYGTCSPVYDGSGRLEAAAAPDLVADTAYITDASRSF